MKRIILVAIIVLLISLALNYAIMAADSPKLVFDKYMKAIKAGNKNAMLGCVIKWKKKEFESFDKAKQEQILALLKNFTPASYKVKKETIKGNTAYLDVEGKSKPISGKENTMLGKFTLTKEEGKWKISHENWQASSKVK